MPADPLQNALRKAASSRAERLQALLNAVAGEGRMKALREEIERKLEEVKTDLDKGWVRVEDLSARVVALAGQEIARAEQALRKDLASTESLDRLQKILRQSIDDTLASSAFFDRVSQAVREHLDAHEKKQPHPTPRELAGLVVETVREVFADGAKLSPDEIAAVAKAQAETTVQKALTSQLWTAEVARIAAKEAERVVGEQAQRLQEDLTRLRRSVGAEGLRQLETVEGKEILAKIVKACVAEAVPPPAALAAAAQAEIARWAGSPDWEKQVAARARTAAEDAIRNDPNLRPEALAAALKKVIVESGETLRKEFAGALRKEEEARAALEKGIREAVALLKKETQESLSRIEETVRAGDAEEEVETYVTPEEARAIAAEEATKRPAEALDPEAVRRIVREETARRGEPTREPLSPEALTAALAAEPVQRQIKGWIQATVAEAMRAETSTLLRKIDEAVTRRATEAAREAAPAADPAQVSTLVQETVRRLLKEEVRPLKEALLQALPAEIQHAVEKIVERQGADWGAQLLTSESFLEAVRQAVAEEISQGLAAGGKETLPAAEEPRPRPFRAVERGTIREHFLALREKNRWKQRGK